MILHQQHESREGQSPPRALVRQIEAVKEGARIEEVAAHYGEFKLAGSGRLVGRCLSPEHADRTPSMTLYPEEQRFQCYGCNEGGDVIDLVRLAEGGELWEAMVLLSQRYGTTLPERPRSWFNRQERQERSRNAIDAEKVEHVRMLLYRLIFVPWLRRLPEFMREEAADRAWDKSLPLARQLYEQRRGA